MQTSVEWQDFQQQASAIVGEVLSSEVLEAFEALYSLMVEANKTTNLTRITALSDFCTRHLLDSLTLVPFLQPLPAEFSLVDIGSGAGFPALPLAILFPKARITAVEATGKKAAFIQSAAPALGLTNIAVLADRAETLAHQPQNREAYDIAVARAVSTLPTLTEFCLPWVKVGGRFYAMKTSNATHTEVPAAENAIRMLGGQLLSTEDVSRDNLPNRQLIVIEKIQSTPMLYPRNAGLISRKPLA